MKKTTESKMNFSVTIPQIVFQFPGKLFRILAIILFVFFVIEDLKTEIEAGLYIFCVILIMIGYGFSKLSNWWKMEVFEDKLIIYKFGKKKFVPVECITEARITDKNSILLMSDNKKIAHIDAMCNEKEKLLDYINEKKISIVNY